MHTILGIIDYLTLVLDRDGKAGWVVWTDPWLTGKKTRGRLTFLTR